MLDKAMIAVLATLLLAATTNDVPAGVDRTIADITARPAYAHSVFGIFVADQTTGQTLIDRMGEKMFVAASIMKTYSTATALKAYGPGYRFRTPVYRTELLRAVRSRAISSWSHPVTSASGCAIGGTAHSPSTVRRRSTTTPRPRGFPGPRFFRIQIRSPL